MNKNIRIAIIMGDGGIPAWACLMLKKVIETHCCEFVLKIQFSKSISNNEEDKSVFDNFIFHKIYKPIDRKIFRCAKDAFKLIHFEEFINTERIILSPKAEGPYYHISDEDVSKIKNSEIDIIIDLEYKLMKGGIFEAATYGIWQYYHGDTDVTMGIPVGFWEVFKNKGVIGTTLKKLNEDPNYITVLEKAYYRSDENSYNRNINDTAWKSVPILSRKIKELKEIGHDAFLNSIQERNNHPVFYSENKFEIPGNAKMIKLILIHFLQILTNKLTSIFFIEQWILLYSFHKKDSFTFPLFEYKKIIPPKDRFWADPFIVYKGGKYYIFIEELYFNNNKGHISVLEIYENGKYSMPVEIIKQKYHLSYPFIFEINEEIFMIPETSQNKTIELYKCTEFPYKWELMSCLMENVIAVDTTIHFDGIKYWLFTTIQENEGSNKENELYLFYSDSIHAKDWTPHPKNPVVSDVKKSRCAGNLFTYNGKLYRPSQNCSNRYGYGLQINEIVYMNEKDYEEKLVNSILPDWDKKVVATHTLNSTENLTIIDGIYKRSRI